MKRPESSKSVFKAFCNYRAQSALKCCNTKNNNNNKKKNIYFFVFFFNFIFTRKSINSLKVEFI